MNSPDYENLCTKDPALRLQTFLDENPLFSEYSSLLSGALRLLRDPLAGFDELSNLLNNYPALSAKIMKLSNTPYYGGTSSFSKIHQAAAVLGARYFSSIACTSITEALYCDHERSEKLHNELWRHSLLTAILARQIALALGTEIDSEEAYITGLLHDLGKLILLILYPDQYEKTYHDTKDDDSLLRAEEKAFGKKHPEIGGIFVQKYLIDERIGWGILSQYHPLRRISLSGVVNMANTLASGRRMNLNCIKHSQAIADWLGQKEFEVNEDDVRLIGVQ